MSQPAAPPRLERHAHELAASSEPHSEPERGRGLTFHLVFAWGLLGVLALFVRALVRLAPMAWEPIGQGSLSSFQVALYVGWVLFNGYGEGYRAFQKSFCPRVVARAYHLAQHPRPLFALLAPAYCLSLFHASRRRLTVAWIMIAVIALLVALLRITPQPWRGIVDGGVVVALVWGALAIVIFGVRALLYGPPRVKLDLPEL